MKRHSLGFFLLGVFIVLLGIKLVHGSLYSYAPDRIQFVVYGQTTRLYSINLTDQVNYYVAYAPDVKIVIPHGYGTYRIGSLSKLIRYEKKPELISKAFSTATSSFVTFYFYPANSEVYYGETPTGEYRKPSFQELFFYRSNARLLDRVFLYMQMLTSSSNSFQPLDVELLTEKRNNDLVLTPDVFGDEYKGFFYNRTYRTERLSVQIKYANNYNTAATIGKILEGNGVRVVDITQSKESLKQCSITTKGRRNSRTVRDMSSFFGCVIVEGSPERSDIIITLGDLESGWEL